MSNLLRIFCALGIHSWQIDEVDGEAVYRCRRCGRWRSPLHDEARRL